MLTITKYTLHPDHSFLETSCHSSDFQKELHSIFNNIKRIFQSNDSSDTLIIVSSKIQQNTFNCTRHCLQADENHIMPQVNIISCTMQSEKFHRILPPSLNEYTPESNQAAYERIYSQITERYINFDPITEIGYGNSAGITSNIEGISKKSLIGAMMHIRDNELLLKECRSNSRSAPFFDKFYLMSNKESGWNLRLHFFNAKSNGLGGEDSPHYHRWTLASQVLTGGYCNRNYDEQSSEQIYGNNHRHIYDKYQLASTNSQGASDSRDVKSLGKKAMIPIKAEIFDRDSLNHFPIALPHSVQTMPRYFGSTVTFAHTSASQYPDSFSFKKPKELGKDLDSLPEKRADNDPKFKENFDKAIVTLQLLKLQDELKSVLEMKWEDGEKLTEYERSHQYDSYERNYLETSLLSALAIYKMEKENNIPHREFSSYTVKFLDKALASMNQKALDQLIENNQFNIEEGLFSVEVFNSHEELMEKFDQEFIDGLDRRS